MALAPWEVKLLRQLSSAYVAMLRQAEDPNCPPPWGHEPTANDRDRIERNLDAMFAMLSG